VQIEQGVQNDAGLYGPEFERRLEREDYLGLGICVVGSVTQDEVKVLSKGPLPPVTGVAVSSPSSHDKGGVHTVVEQNQYSFDRRSYSIENPIPKGAAPGGYLVSLQFGEGGKGNTLGCTSIV